MPDGTPVEAITLTGGETEATIITYGATLQSVRVPSKDGAKAEVTAGFDDLPGYLADNSYFGSTIGRYANRIADGRFALDGQIHSLSRNDKGHTLHGGAEGFNRRAWEVVSVRRGAQASVTLRLVSPDGDQGFPGTLLAMATYAVDAAGAIWITYRATTYAPTVVSMTNHAYWNLTGDPERGARGMRLSIPAQSFLPVDAGLIPTGETRPVEATPFDFRAPAIIGQRLDAANGPQIERAGGYDHCWIIGDGRAAEPRLAALLQDPPSGRVLEMFSTEPGLQFYSGNFLDGATIGRGRRPIRKGDAICLEPHLFPDAPNRPDFLSARLDPGETYEHRMVLRFSLID